MALMLTVACDRQGRNAPALDASASGTIQVSLELDFQGEGDGEGLELEMKVPDASTAFELLQLAKAQGDMEFEATGSGELAFVTSINGIQNQGAGGRNWVFYVNDELANAGSGDYKLNESDKVLWKFKDNGLK